MAPALFTGKVRDVIEDGSLSLYVGMQVAKPGRYVISARVDGADGKSFAYLRFIDPPPPPPGAQLFCTGELLHPADSRDPPSGRR